MRPAPAPATRQRLRLAGGAELSFITAGEPSSHRTVPIFKTVVTGAGDR